MSEVNKPENNTDLKCLLDPDQYKVKVNDTVAPVGSYPWAMIQVYLGKKVSRSNWDSSVEYIRLAGLPDDLPYIEKRKQNDTTHWQPIQEDMLACDWKSLESGSETEPTSDNYMLSFDLKVGIGNFSASDQNWGYLADYELEFGSDHEGPFGTLTSLQNKTEITKLLYFAWNSDSPEINLRVSSGNPPNQESYQKMVELFKKELTVTVSDVAYHLGGSEDVDIFAKGQYEFAGSYNNDDAKKLGALLQQNLNNKLHFNFNWK
ncbi:Thoeris anti-defense Tad2 family protein [Xenorhabdus sp. IM139775]|uniref:Thoeris anti-defense Tad2 family protein n=1 Tax=Xenorhabdus sp. IM139775 TaxID=3025876 RepID=UPI0023592E9D|nr:MW1434 family type I TA system toxin [Xenorhabdus sp. IM139775]MDC9594457.1 DUF2829 domain-containing protein [Xenorhabdus sp. IM139775]